MNESTCLIDGFGPLPLVRPDSVANLCEVVRQARDDGTALYPIGGQTMLALGMPPVRQGKAVSTLDLMRVIDFPARDMTITVEAGITMAHLRDILAKEKLRLPLDIPRADQATLGGVIAANVSGPRRYGVGTARDYVIGISAVNDEGNEFKAGGRVVKNVAGYDLCKLLVGSLGTLGIITQVTLKLRPLPDERALLTLACAGDALETTLNQLHASRTRPVCIELFNKTAAREVFSHAKLPLPEGDWALVVGFEGNGEAVQWQVQQLIREIGCTGSLEAYLGFTGEPLWRAMSEWSLWPTAGVTFKAAVLPSALARYCVSATQSSDATALGAHAGNGIVVGHLSARKEDALRALTAWRREADLLKGSVVATRCPHDWKKALPVWGPAPAHVWLTRKIKQQFDPRGIFNPGRLVDGI